MTGLNSFFEQNGFSSKVLVKNMGSSFVYLVIYLLSIILYLLLTPLGRFFYTVNLVRNFLGQQLFMKYTLILFFSQFPPMLLASLINIYNVNFNGTLQSVSTGVSFAILAVLPFGLIATWLLIRKSRQQGGNESFSEKYGELKSDDLRPTIIGSHWKVIVTIRWAITIIIMVFLRDHYEF